MLIIMKYSESHIHNANFWTGLGPSSGTPTMDFRTGLFNRAPHGLWKVYFIVIFITVA
jgi:hypothetical protein